MDCINHQKCCQDFNPNFHPFSLIVLNVLFVYLSSFFWGQWPMEYQGVSIFPNIFFVASLCSFICLQAVYKLSGTVCKATWNGYPSYSLLTFISRFVD